MQGWQVQSLQTTAGHVHAQAGLLHGIPWLSSGDPVLPHPLKPEKGHDATGSKLPDDASGFRGGAAGPGPTGHVESALLSSAHTALGGWVTYPTLEHEAAKKVFLDWAALSRVWSPVETEAGGKVAWSHSCFIRVRAHPCHCF